MYTTSKKKPLVPRVCTEPLFNEFCKVARVRALAETLQKKRKAVQCETEEQKAPLLKRGVGGLQGGENAGETKARHGGRAPCRDEPRLAEEGGTCPRQSNGVHTAWRVAEGELHLAGGGARSGAFARVPACGHLLALAKSGDGVLPSVSRPRANARGNGNADRRARPRKGKRK